MTFLTYLYLYIECLLFIPGPLHHDSHLTSLLRRRLVADFVAAVDGFSADSAWVKHYNFVDFSHFGSAWSPTYFNVVRDPVERVKI